MHCREFRSTITQETRGRTPLGGFGTNRCNGKLQGHFKLCQGRAVAVTPLLWGGLTQPSEPADMCLQVFGNVNRKPATEFTDNLI